MTDDPGRPKTAAIAIGLGLVGFLSGVVGVSFAATAVESAIGPVGALYEQWVFVLGFGAGAVAAVGYYLQVSDRGLAFVDWAWPTRRDLAAIVVGVVAIFGLYGLVTAVRSILEVPAAQSQVEQAIRASPDPVAVAGLVVLSVIVVGPSEELLFRNVVQKRLRAAYAAPAAIGLASIFFGVLHLGQYGSGPPLGTVVSLVTVVALATILGSVYEWTENLVVPAAVHGLFNAIQIAYAWLVLA